MPFTGDRIHDWRVVEAKQGRRVKNGTGQWVDETVVELVKGHNHIRGEGQDGIDPELVLGRCVTAALAEDLRVATEAGEFDRALPLADQLDRHERRQRVREVTAAVQRVERRIANKLLLKAVKQLHGDLPKAGHIPIGPATVKGTVSYDEGNQRVVRDLGEAGR